MGVLQALEAVKILSGVGRPLSRQLLLFDALAGRFTTVKLRARAPGCFACGGGGEGAEEEGEEARAADGAAAGDGGASAGDGISSSSSGDMKSAAAAQPGISGGGGGSSKRSRGRMQPADVAAFDYTAFTGQSANDGPPPPLRVLPPEQRLSAPEFRRRLEDAGLLQPLPGGGSSTGGASWQPLLLDVRPQAQFEVMSLPGAVNLPLDTPEWFRERVVPRVLEMCGVVAAPAAAPPAAPAAAPPAAAYGSAAAGEVATTSPGEQGSGGQQQQQGARPVYVLCRRGNNSQLAVRELLAAGLTDVFDLIGGVEAWATEVDPSMPVL